MENPSILLSDIATNDPTKLDSSAENLSISLSSSSEMLVITGKTVFWYKGETLSRKLIYETYVVNAFFTFFNGPKKEFETKEKTLVVVLGDSAYVYYRDGRSYVLSFPFQINNALPYENGIILEREQKPFNQFLTVTEPMKELGSVISSSTSSICSNERLLHFPRSQEYSITVTFDSDDNSINLYNTRFLNRSDDHLLGSSIRRKPSQSVRRTSLAPSNKEEPESLGDEIKIEKKRSTSHSQILSIDRMASYDFNASSKSTDTMSYSPLDSTSLRKDAFLYKMENIKLNLKADINHMKVRSLKFGGKEGVIIQNPGTGLFQILIFEISGNSVSSPKFLKYLNLSEDYLDYGSTMMEGFIVLLNTNNECILFNPFLHITTTLAHDLSTDFPKISRIHDTFDNNLVIEDDGGTILNFNLVLGPRKEIIERLLSIFKWMTNPYTYNYIRITWINSFAIVKNEWEAYALTVLSIVLPVAVNQSPTDESDLISKLLSKVDILQIKNIENQFSIPELAPNVVLALHIIREELKLNILHSKIVDDMSLLLAHLTYWMGWGENWYGYYGHDFNTLNKSIKFQQIQLLQDPPSIFKSLSSLFDRDIEPYCTFSRLVQESESVDELVTPRTFYVLRLFEAIISPAFSPSDIVNMMAEFNITTQTLETYPIGILIPLKEAISHCQQNISSLDESLQNFELLERKDLEVLTGGFREKFKEKSSNLHTIQHQIKDIHQIISSIQDLSEPLAPIEYDRFTITKLIFSEDRSFYEISKILQTFQVQTVLADDLASLPEQASLLKQEELSSLVAARTLTIPIGRSMLFFSSKIPLVTERFPVPKMNFNTLIQPENVTVSYERSKVEKDALEWGYFHNGAASGLTISKDSSGISGSWIVFNKPDNLSPQHGGFLLGLGLNGHLTALEEWNIYNYLGPKHSFTSVGLLLGMSASLRGTMDMKLTKVLSVHVVALLPRGASDLIISTPVQTAGLIGIGLLYLETQHRRMSVILLSQINSNVIAEEKQVANESYRLAAGIGLGYVNLGKGNDLQGLNDTHVVDKLLEIAISMKDVQSEDGYDKSMAGAIIALTFIYLKTGNEAIAKKLKVPETEQLLDYVRPDILLLRALGGNLILWDEVGNTSEWIKSRIPKVLSSRPNENLSYYYILSGLCLSIGIKFASTSNPTAKTTILGFYDEITNHIDEIRVPRSFIARQRKRALSNAQIILAISLSLIMAATGDLEVFKRLRILHGKFSNSSPAETFGRLMATNMALGFLFLGGGQYAFDTSSNFAIAALVTSIYPLYPNNDISEPDVHLQALRHFWSLSVEQRCLVVRDVENNKPIKTDVKIDFKDGESKTVGTPCLLPPLDSIRRLTTETKEYYKLIIDDLGKFKENTDIFVFKKKRIEVLKHSVKVILNEINAKFEESHTNDNKLADLKLFKDFKKADISFLLEEVSPKGFSPNIIDRQIELNELAQRPENADDLWNLKLLFAFYDRVLNEDDVNYLSLEFVDMLQNKLWLYSRSL